MTTSKLVRQAGWPVRVKARLLSFTVGVWIRGHLIESRHYAAKPKERPLGRADSLELLGRVASAPVWPDIAAAGKNRAYGSAVRYRLWLPVVRPAGTSRYGADPTGRR